jgi:hypothetical protein
VCEKVLDALDRPADVVGDDTVRVEVACGTVDEDERSAGASLFVEVCVIVARRNDDDPIDTPFAERADQLALAAGILVAASGEDEDATLACGILDGAMKL